VLHRYLLEKEVRNWKSYSFKSNWATVKLLKQIVKLVVSLLVVSNTGYLQVSISFIPNCIICQGRFKMLSGCCTKLVKNEWKAWGISGVFLASLPVMLPGLALGLPWAIQHKCSSCATMKAWLICMCEGQDRSSIQTRARGQKASDRIRCWRTESRQVLPLAYYKLYTWVFGHCPLSTNRDFEINEYKIDNTIWHILFING